MVEPRLLRRLRFSSSIRQRAWGTACGTCRRGTASRRNGDSYTWPLLALSVRTEYLRESNSLSEVPQTKNEACASSKTIINYIIFLFNIFSSKFCLLRTSNYSGMAFSSRMPPITDILRWWPPVISTVTPASCNTATPFME